MIFRQAILKTKGDSEEIEQKFLPFSKRAKQNAYLEDPGILFIYIYIIFICMYIHLYVQIAKAGRVWKGLESNN